MKARAAPLDSLRAYVIAFSRTGNTQLGDSELPVVVALYEMPPPENDEFATYSLASARRMCAMTTTYTAFRPS